MEGRPVTLNIAQFKGGGSSVGDLRHFINGSAAPLLTLQGQQWLKTGALIPYVPGDHSRLLSLFPGLGSKGMPGGVALPASNPGRVQIHKLSVNYVYVQVNPGGAPATAHSADLVSWTTTVSGLTNASRTSVVINDKVVVVGSDSSPNGMYRSTAGTAAGGWAPVIGAVNIPHECAASNGALAVFGRIDANTNAGLHLATSTTGDTVTQRTGVGGGNFRIFGMHWSPCAAAFLFIGATAINKTADGYTQTACTLPAGANFTQDGYGLQDRAASSATATVLIMADGRLLRTTDGTTFTIIDLSALNVAGVQMSDARIVYDGTKFVISMIGGAIARPAFAYSTDDGATWQASCAFDDYSRVVADAWTPRGMSVANGKLLMMASVNSPTPSILYDITGMVDDAPDNVGTQRTLQRSESVQLSTVAYVRTK